MTVSGSSGGAGIGGGVDGRGGKIVIEGGTVNATGVRYNAAGIGGGWLGNGGRIIINGGTVNATGARGANLGACR